MPDKRIYWDASVFTAYINGEKGRFEIVKELLTQSTTGKIQIVTSTASIVEVAFSATEKAGRALLQEEEDAIDALWADRDAIKLIEVSELLQREARQFVRVAMERGWKCKPLDAMHMASAKMLAPAELHTYNEKDFKKFEAELGTKVSEPYLEQTVLGLDS